MLWDRTEYKELNFDLRGGTECRPTLSFCYACGMFPNEVASFIFDLFLRILLANEIELTSIYLYETYEINMVIKMNKIRLNGAGMLIHEIPVKIGNDLRITQ